MDTRCCTVDTELDAHWNDPGQDALRYRIGTWSDFYSRAKYALSRAEVEDDQGAETRPLAALTTREADDPTIALLDAWSVVLDVLTFYQERIANEGFLRTATERQSVLYLARSIGYELSPGVAASARLAFTVEDSAGAPESVTIEEGLPVMSIPGPDELPQTFETVEEREIRAEWNAMTPVLWEDHPVGASMTTAYIQGITSRLQVGDWILIVGDERADILASGSGPGGGSAPGGKEGPKDSERWHLRQLTDVKTFPEDDYTLLTWAGELQDDQALVQESPTIHCFRVRTPVFGHNAPPWISFDLTSRVRLYEYYTEDDWPWPDSTGTSDPVEPEPGEGINKWPGTAFRYIFIDHDPESDDGSAAPKGGATADDEGERWVDLDGEHKGVMADSWVVFLQGASRTLGKILDARIESRSDFALSGKVTWVSLDTGLVQLEESEEESEGGGGLGGGDDEKELDPLSPFTRRRALALAESEELTWSQKPISTNFPDPTGYDSQGYQLSDVIDGLEAGMYVYITGERTDTGETETELVEIESVTTHTSSGNTVFTPVTELENTYVRDTVTMNANVVLATHGETASEEVLGSGDGSKENQSFTLRKYPLTYVSAATVTGSESTLTLRVGGVAWEEVSSLYDQEADASLYVIRVDDDSKATVSFGDGLSGARLPTGQENVTATYRFGLGEDGNVGADTLKLMKRRPLGVKSVTNPIEAKGGEDPETLADARENAPLTVLTLDRLVSLSDYEDFARAFAGVAKAASFDVWAGQQRRVHLTIAGVDGAELEAGDETYDNLLAAIKLYRDPTQRVEIKSCTTKYFRVWAELSVDTAYVTEDVFAAAKSALEEAFSFDERAFAQSVTAAEIVSLLQAVDGVLAVDLNGLWLSTDADPTSETVAENALSAVLLASAAAWNSTTKKVDPAELLLIDTSEGGILLEEMN